MNNTPAVGAARGVEGGTCFEGKSDSAKALANAKARAALLGAVLIESTDDKGRPEYIVAQGVWVRAFASVVELLAWLDAREGRK